MISSNVAFLVNTSAFDDACDIESDDMKIWKNKKVYMTYVSVKKHSCKVSEVTKTKSICSY
jgi:hypothetical protein